MSRCVSFLSAAVALFFQTARAEVIFGADVPETLDGRNLQIYVESPAKTASRPGLSFQKGRIIGRPGNGNFTAYKFTDVGVEPWTLALDFTVPAGVRYSNSGV